MKDQSHLVGHTHLGRIDIVFCTPPARNLLIINGVGYRALKHVANEQAAILKAIIATAEGKAAAAIVSMHLQHPVLPRIRLLLDAPNKMQRSA